MIKFFKEIFNYSKFRDDVEELRRYKNSLDTQIEDSYTQIYKCESQLKELKREIEKETKRNIELQNENVELRNKNTEICKSNFELQQLQNEKFGFFNNEEASLQDGDNAVLVLREIIAEKLGYSLEETHINDDNVHIYTK